MVSMSDDSTYQIQVYTDLTDASDPESGQAAYAIPYEAEQSFAGVQTIEIPEVTLKQGSRYSVVITNAGSNTISFGVEANTSYKTSGGGSWFTSLAGIEYPGRGICIGRSPDGTKAMIAYWIMGRSANSRNRVFDAIPGGIRTVASDPAKMEFPHLIIYYPVLTLNDTTIVTNGDQTDTIYRYMRDNLFPGYGFEAALATRTFEDDAPNFTPRISGVVDMRRGGYKLSILKSCDGNPASVQRLTFDYPQPVAGEGQLITTYQKNGSPIPSFAGEPLRVTLDQNDADEFAGKLWEALNEDNKVSLFVRAITLETGDYEDVILNKYNTVEG